MAGDWIPFLKDLPKKPEVLRIAEATGSKVCDVVLALLEFWAWVDDQTTDGRITGMSSTSLSAICPALVPSFVDALQEVGWLKVQTTGRQQFIDIPNFERWMGRSAKRRLLDRERKRIYRENLRLADVLSRSRQDMSTVTETIQRQDSTKKNPPNPPASVLSIPIPKTLDVDGFRDHWLEYIHYRIEVERPLTPIAAKQQLGRLAGWGPARAVAALVYTMAQGWLGVQEEKPARGRDNGRPPESPAERAERLARERKARAADAPAPELSPQEKEQLRRQAAQAGLRTKKEEKENGR